MKNKRLMALVIGKMKNKEGSKSESSEEAPEDDEDMDGEGLQAAADDVMSALEAGDSKAFMEALRSFVEQC